MSRSEYQGLLQIAKEQVPIGIYALEKADYAELRNDHCKEHYAAQVTYEAV